MTARVLERFVPVEPERRRIRGATAVLLVGGALSLAIFVLYLAAYPLRHAKVPAGFDAPWYVWRAQYVAAKGIGPLGTAARPGHAVLSALLGTVTGMSQLRLSVVFSQLLPALLALAVGAFAYVAMGRDRLTWAITVALTGAALGATRLVGENIANLLNLTLEVGALVVLVSVRDRRRAVCGTVLLLVAAGLAHWAFLAVFGAILAVAIVLSWLASRATPEPRLAPEAEEVRVLTMVGVATALVITFLIAVVLRAPFTTLEIGLNPLEYAAKLITDVARLWPAVLLALLGVAAMVAAARQRGSTLHGDGERRFSARLLIAWALVSVAGVLTWAAGIKVSRYALPPHRFLALLVAFPGMVLAGAGVRWASGQSGRRLARRMRGRVSRPAAAVVVVAALALVLVPTVTRWYRYPILMTPEALQQAKTASGYVEGLPAGQAFVFVVGPEWPRNDYAAPLRERMIRIELPADRQEGLYVFPGSPSDLLAGRRTITGFSLTDKVTLPYWRDVAPILRRSPPVLVLQGMGQGEFDQAVAIGAAVVAPGVALLRGPPPGHSLAEAPAPDAASGTGIAILQGILLLALLSVAGAGWAQLVFGPDSPSEVWMSLAPVVGTGALLLGAFVATELGLRTGAAGGPVTYMAVTLAGMAAWRWSAGRARRAREPTLDPAAFGTGGSSEEGRG